ncbi:MAG: DUF4143 domain-containing protein [Chitinivibrionales bacterium]|nr:DUF4143 domain-containing protein [Chitinivibrionales bacterium]
MQTFVPRRLSHTVIDRLSQSPVVALLGPRQCGKSTLALHVLKHFPGARHLDLELPSERNKLVDPEEYFKATEGRLVCIDEIQRAPDLFQVMRAVVDQRGVNGQFLVLGSASRDLLKQSSETLAGRISYLELTPFTPDEIAPGPVPLRDLWVRGGFPRSYLAPDLPSSSQWRLHFARTFLERDIPRLAPRLSVEVVERLWRMCAHEHGQTANLSKLASALGVSDKTVRSYLHLLGGAFMLRLLPPFLANTRKRLVKSPKVYLRDTGVLHVLLGVSDYEELLGHPMYGYSWEGLVIEALLARQRPLTEAYFYRAAGGAEIDLVLVRGTRTAAIEIKASSSPTIGAGFYHAADDIGADARLVVSTGDETYPIGKGIIVTSLNGALTSHHLSPFIETDLPNGEPQGPAKRQVTHAYRTGKRDV